MTSLAAGVRAELGRHLRELRRAQGLTLAGLAEKVGVTPSALSQIERGKSEPSLGTLWRLGRALNASLFDFFAREEAPTVDVTRAGDRTVVEFERLRYEAVARSAQRQIDLFFLYLRPGEGPVRELTTHAGEESGVVLSGSMDVVVAGQRHRLGPGDGIWFLSSQPHTFEPVGAQECVSVWADTVVDPGVTRGGGSIFEAGGVRAAPVARRAAATSPRRTRGDPALAAARALPIDAAQLREVVERLASVGSSPLGFRTTGTPEDREVAAYVAAQMRAIGLDGVAIEDVAVDGWRFEGAALAVAGHRFEASSMGGVPPTPHAGIEAPLVDAGAAEPRRLDRLELAGTIALVDWRKAALPLCDIALELGLRGAAGVVANCPAGADYYQSDGVIGAFDGHWHDGAPPMVLIAKEDAAAVRATLDGGARRARMTLRAQRLPGVRGANVVGSLPGEAGGPIVVGAHHDGWFRAAFDNATGVAAMLGVARGLAAAGHRPRHRVCFTSRTAEEYGLQDSSFDWCIGAWRQVRDTHPEWGEQAPFHLCVEASGHPDLRLVLEAPVELAGWARAAGRAGRREGWLTSGCRVGPPVTGTEQWPLLVSGVPGVAAYTWEKSFARTDYHTPRDTPAIVDFDHLERLTRFYAYLLLRADADPDGILDHRARAEDVASAAARLGPAGERLRVAAGAHAGAGGRAAFTRVGRALVAVDAGGSIAYPHQQAAKDVAGLQDALAALRAGDRRGAARALTKVGANAVAPLLSEATFARRARRLRPAAAGASWASASHLTASPELWAEIAALGSRAGAPVPGRWVERSLERHLERSRAELSRRVEAMAGALEATVERRST
jgi:transcriptional regulator with XRE-family HTH domain/Iap family predicted aminopeptidase